MSKPSSPIAHALKSAGSSVLSFIGKVGGRTADLHTTTMDDDDDDDSLSFENLMKESTGTASAGVGGRDRICDWAVENCNMGTAPLTKCNIDGCMAHLHHVCQIEWQQRNGMSPGGCAKLCRQHHPKYHFIASANPHVSAAAAASRSANAGKSAVAVGNSPLNLTPFPSFNSPTDEDPTTISTAMKVSLVSSKKKARSPIESTAHKRTTVEAAVARGSKKGKGLVKGPRICPNARVVVMQRHLVKLLLPDHAAFEIVSGKPPSFPFVGQVMKAAAVGNKVKGKKQHPIRFDLLPHDNNIIICKRDAIRTLGKDEDEPEYDEKQARIDALLEVCENPNRPSNEYGSEDDVASNYSGQQSDLDDSDNDKGKNKKKTKKKRSVVEMEMFLNEQTDDDIKCATSYKHYYGEKDNEYIEWTILKDGEEIVEDVMLAPPPSATPFGYNIPWSRYPKDINYSNIFFDHFFPSLVGKAAVLDEYLGNMRCSCHDMVISDKIKFHAPSRPDPDYIVSFD